MWWLLAGGLVALELITGTFFLLMLSTGAVAGALVAHLGGSDSLQISVAAVVGTLACALWYLKQKRAQLDRPLGVQNSPDLSLDLGQTVTVDHWHDDGSTHVMYRGAMWSARLKPSSATTPPQPGAHRIAAMQGNLIYLEKV
jgi:membrane protein implicated in regulation of membrane protease activity